MKRRIRLLLSYLLFLLVLVEGSAFVAFWALDGELFSYARVREHQEQVAAGDLEEFAEQAQAELRLGKRNIAMHPYTGYLPIADFKRRPVPDSVRLIAQEFYEPSAPHYGDDPDTVIVGVSGGSVAAMFCDKGFEFLRAELAKSPQYAGKRIFLVSLSVGGFKQPQQLMALEYLFALGGRLDLLLNLDGFNEVALHEAVNGRRGVFPVYPSNWYGYAHGLSDLDSLTRVGELAYVKQRRVERAQGVLDSKLRASVARNLLWKLRDRGLSADEARAVTKLEEHETPRRDPSLTGPRLDLEGQAALYAELVAIWKRCSVQMERNCLVNGVRYLHFLQPNQYIEGSKPLSLEEQAQAYDEGHKYAPGARVGYPLLRAAGAELAAEGVAFHDLSRIFAEVEETLYIDTCCHLNVRGNELLARSIAQAILAGEN